MAKPLTGPIPSYLAKLRLRRLLDRLAPLLRPGSYRLYANMALRTDGEPLAEHQRGLLRDNRIRAAGTRLAEALPPRWVDLPRHNGPAPADSVLFRGEWTLLLTADGHGVLRLTHDPERVRRLIDNAEWLGRAYPCPAIEGFDAGSADLHGVRESFVDGTPIRNVAPEQADAAFRDLLEHCARHAARHDGRFDYAGTMTELEKWPLPAWLRQAIAQQRSAIHGLLDDAPMLRCHGDCHDGNVLVQPDGRVALIDLQRVQPLPFFFDALSLPRGSGVINGYLRRRYLDGAYDAELRRVWQAAGREYDPEARPAALLAMAIAHAFRVQYAGKPVKRRRDKFVQAAEKFRADCGF